MCAADGESRVSPVALNREGVNVEDQLLVICGVDRMADQPDEPVLLIETKGDEVLLGVPAPSAIGNLRGGICRPQLGPHTVAQDLSESENDGSYPAPPDGWVCYHCG